MQSSYSQNPYRIQADVIDAENDSLFGNALLLSPIDSSLITGTYFTSGHFAFEGVQESEVLLKITSLGQVDSIISITNMPHRDLVDLGTIQMRMEDIEMGEVTITGRVPLFEPTTDGAVKVNVQNTMLASSTSVLEVLGKSPNVLVGDGGVTVIGKGDALIYLDGNPITMQQLGSISVDQIKSIEVITNPSARYDASGKAVINITTVQNNSEGVSASYTHHSIFARNYLIANFLTANVRKGKWSFSGDFGLSGGRDWDQLEATRTLALDAGPLVSRNFHLNENKFAFVSNYRLGAAYAINENHRLSLEFRGFANKLDLNEAVRNDITAPGGNQSTLSTQNDGWYRGATNSLVFNYIADFDTLGSNLFVGAQYSDFEGLQNDLIDEEVSTESEILYRARRNTKGQNDIGILTSQVDYTKYLTKDSRLVAGAKLTRAQNDGLVNFYTKPEGASTFDFVSALSNDFEYDEMIPAAYVEYGGKLKNLLDYNLGLRAEYTQADGVSNVLNQQVIDTNYVNVFPTAAITAKVSPIVSLGFGYASRIERPKYQDLDPFVQYQDSLTSFQGNPFLIPELTQAFEFSVNYQGFNFFKAGYNRSLNSFRDIVETGPLGGNSVVLRTVNVQQLNSYFATLTIPIDVSIWSSYNTVSLTFDKVIDDRPEFSSSTVQPKLYIYSYNKFRIGELFDFEATAEYVGRQNDGIYFTEPTYSIGAAVSKKFLKDALTVRILANDIFRSYRQAGEFEIGPTQVVYDNRLNTNYYRLTLTYNFGKLKNITYNNQSTGKGEINRIKTK